jgi:hypothetical protein
MLSPGILRHATLVRTEVLEECIASIIRVTRIGDLGTTLAGTSNRSTLRRNTSCALQLLETAKFPFSPILVTLMMEAILSSETSVLT